ncbi:MAG TPA: hypothetical protein PK264_01005 [Hyphomicrobiaceae bacterium]|nr:hypothetical protein [Hyphomicrobiaceae bacterium]
MASSNRPPRRAFNPERERWSLADADGYAIALAALAVLWIVLVWPWARGEVTIPWDAKAHFQPQIQFLAQSLWSGEWPSWTPYVFSGHPQIADPQSMIFSAPFLILALVNPSPSLWAVDMTVLLSGLAGAVALALWFRDQEWHWAGALIAGLVFCFGASMSWRMQHTGQVLSLAALPFALLWLDRAIDRGSFIYGMLAGIAAAHMLLGRDQVALICLYILAAYVPWRWLSDDEPRATILRSILPLMLGGLIAVALVAVPLLLTASLAAESNRPAIDFEGAGRGSLHPALLVTFLAPQIFGAAGAMADYWGPPSFTWHDTGLYIAQNMGQVYVALIPLLMIALGLFSGRLWSREIRFFTVALALVILYALGWYTPVFRGFYEVLPGVKFYRRPADATFVIGALAAILSGYAVARMFEAPWLRPRGLHVLGVAALVVAGLILMLAIGWRLDRLERAWTPLLIAGGWLLLAVALIAWAWPRVALSPHVAALALAVVTTADLAWNNGKTTSSAMPPEMYEAMEPTTRNETITWLKRLTGEGKSDTRRDRVELVGLGFHWPNLSLTHRLEATLGYNPVRLGRYSRATGAEDTVGLPDQRKFAPLFKGYASPLARLLGLRYIATPIPIEKIDKAAMPGELTLVVGTAEGYIYENRAALPRVLFAIEARPLGDPEAIITSGRWPDFDPRTTVLLEGPLPASRRRRPGTVRILDYRNTDVVIEATSSDGGFLVLNDLWHPWWQAEIEVQGGALLPAPILRANLLFRAVEVPAGDVKVRFTFNPLAGLLQSLRQRSASTPASH